MQKEAPRRHANNIKSVRVITLMLGRSGVLIIAFVKAMFSFEEKVVKRNIKLEAKSLVRFFLRFVLFTLKDNQGL